MKDLLKRVAPILRGLGLRGSGQNYRKQEGDFVFVINFHGSQSGDKFYINLAVADVRSVLGVTACRDRRSTGGVLWNRSNTELLRKFSSGTKQARASLHLARAATRLGHFETARKLVDRGPALAGERATGLRAELSRVLEESAP